ncbi:ParA family protein [Streptomyces sp. WMMB303]|uniref:ParA family protein n=1 Tax=Streptomyces sp. WMMB303 TaxID=3034154 RepID=UPI0023ED97B8|nr:ParA family protein [Streptomyces sp. WMMB303]MDF4254645.1 ParA family protein [Streptomyces sp. WMMB303]
MTPAQNTAADAGPKFVIVIQQKGGAGKSTITVNLAAVSGRSSLMQNDVEDAAVIAAGIDPQGSLETWADQVPEETLPFDYLVTRGEVGVLSALQKDPNRKRVVVDTPGFMEIDPDAAWGADPLGESRVADALREVLDLADLAIVPITPEWLSWAPAEFTIERILKPRGIPFMVVINLHDPRDGDTALDKVKKWIDEHDYPRVPDPIRKYKIHAHAAEDGLTVVEYKESGTALRAREDFMNLALSVEQAL